jgi:hypothetical protein
VFIKQTDDSAFNAIKNTHTKKLIANQFSSSKVINCVGNFSKGAKMPGIQRDIAFSQLAVKGIIKRFHAFSILMLNLNLNMIFFFES